MTLTELGHSRERGFCCGGGGACMWMEHEPGQRINDLRVDEIQVLGVELAAVSCPFCLIMLDEGVTGRSASDTLALKDLAEIIVEAL